jgi:hypothetical protein
MRRTAVLIASALINASTSPGLAAENTSNKDVDASRALSVMVHSQATNATDNEKACRAYVASSYESMMRQAAAIRVDRERMLLVLDTVINAFNDLFAAKCGR